MNKPVCAKCKYSYCSWRDWKCLSQARYERDPISGHVGTYNIDYCAHKNKYGECKEFRRWFWSYIGLSKPDRTW